MKKLLFLLTIIFVLTSFSWFEAKAGDEPECFKIEKDYPIIATESLAVDSNENIYIANGLFNTVQVYDKYGRFEYSIDVGNGGGYYVDIDINDNLVIAFQRGNILNTYDSKGYIISEETTTVLYINENYYESRNEYRVSNTVYRLNKVFGYISVVKDIDGKYKNLFNISVWNWLLNLFLNFLIAVFCITIIFIIYRGRKKQKNEFNFRSYYFWCEFGKALIEKGNKFGNNYEEKDFKKMELIRYSISWLIVLILIVYSVVFIFNTGGLNNRGFELIVRITGIVFVYMIANLINLVYRYNFNKFNAKRL